MITLHVYDKNRGILMPPDAPPASTLDQGIVWLGRTVSWCVPLLLPASRHPHPVHTFVVFVRRASETSSKGQVVLRPCDEGQQLDHSTSAVSPSGTVANISLSPSPRSPRTLGRKSFAL